MGEFNGDNRPHGYGIHEYSTSTRNKESGIWANGVADGHRVLRAANGNIFYYASVRGSIVHHAIERQTGACAFNREPCDADHAGFAELKAAALAVEVRCAYATDRAIRPMCSHVAGEGRGCCCRNQGAV
jgi:hypothetical protein